ncbi:MAG: HDOD domain-containing protein [Deltaproteobacteria bacterium]|nr:HDOD domain-containing protein [Deltaproteobacteria bacterium]
MKVCKTCDRVYKSEHDFLINTYEWRTHNNKEMWFSCSCGSTLILKAGQFEWFDPYKLLSDRAKTIFNDLALSTHLPRIRTSIERIQNLLEQPDSEAKDIARELKGEPLLAADLLKLANHVRRENSAEINKLEHAIMYVGRRTLRDLVTAAYLKELKFNTHAFTLEMFWQEAFLIGLVSESIVKELSLPLGTDVAYVGGCLSNNGKLVAALCMPEQLDMIYEETIVNQTTWQEAEKRLGAPSHTILGEIAAAFWSLPRFVSETIGHHHDWYSQTDESDWANPGLIDVVILAHQLSHLILDRPHRMENPLFEKACEVFKLSQKDVEAMVKKFAGHRDFANSFV